MSQAALVADDLSKAAIEANAGSPANAILLYQAVLAQVPDQQVALTYGGWLTRLSGINAHNKQAVREGDADLAKVVLVHPDYADGEGLYGVAAYEDLHSMSLALRAFQHCLADNPSAEVLAGIAPVAREAYAKAGRTLPKAFAAS
jgi:tetratricopeptide (TPR) repeat protein